MFKAAPRCTAMNLKQPDGKGTVGCLAFVVLVGIAVFVAITAGPPYMAARSFEADVKTEVSRAGARFYPNETLMKEVLQLARKNEVRLREENVKIERYAGQLFIKVKYQVPIDLLFYEYIMKVDIKASSYVGTL
jgi:hypothetical protein